MTPRFEAHITFDRQWARPVQDAAEKFGWVFSQIDGCPLLGKGVYCYLTNYNTDAGMLRNAMDAVTADLAQQGLIALRLKIERIIYDTKTGVDEL